MKQLFAITLFLLCTTIISSKTFDMMELGADITGKNKCTVLINDAIEKASAEGGGIIYFPAGTYLTGAINMKSNITLYLESGSIIKFSDDFEDYTPFIKVRWEGTFMNTFRPLINAQNAENISIRGRGILDGQGLKWWQYDHPLTMEVRKTGKVSKEDKFQKLWAEANKDLVVADYYKSTLIKKFCRPPFIQFLECKNILIEGVTIKNSPFWTVNPVFCDNIVIHGVTINNPSKDPKGPNTDGINPSSCSNVRISDCFISVGDDCITIKSGRDADGRKYGRPCENITITNCVMLSGHGGIVIGSEMSGGVKKLTISNCIFNGTDNGIRLKASRGRGGIVEEIRMDNIVMNGIKRDAFIFDLFYDKKSVKEEVSERTPVFRNIHMSNITGSDVNRIGYITGIGEMPVDNISFSNINISAKEGFKAQTASNIRFQNVDFATEKGAAYSFKECDNIILDNIRSGSVHEQQSIVELTDVSNAFITNCFQAIQTDIFCLTKNSQVIWGNNYLKNVKSPNKEEK